jgi:hypothetical protein
MGAMESAGFVLRLYRQGSKRHRVLAGLKSPLGLDSLNQTHYRRTAF